MYYHTFTILLGKIASTESCLGQIKFYCTTMFSTLWFIPDISWSSLIPRPLLGMRLIMEISITACQTIKNLTHVLKVVTSIPAFHLALGIWQQSPIDQQRYLIACSCTQQEHGLPPYNKMFLSSLHILH